MAKHPRYNQLRPYRDHVVALQRRMGQTTFTSEAEFWTLGGPEHFEFAALDKIMDFGPKSYHTVDRDRMKSIKNKAVVAHPHTEFMSIYQLWKHPAALSYDSTEQFTPGTKMEDDDTTHDRKFINFLKLAKRAVGLCRENYLMVHANYMIAHPGTRNVHDGSWGPHYERWLGHISHRFSKAKIFDSREERMSNSQTFMVGIHFAVPINTR